MICTGHRGHTLSLYTHNNTYKARAWFPLWGSDRDLVNTHTDSRGKKKVGAFSPDDESSYKNDGNARLRVFILVVLGTRRQRKQL